MLIDDRPRAAWLSRYVVRRERWEGLMAGPAFVNFLLDVARRARVNGWILVPVQDEVVELVAKNRARLSERYRLVTQDWETLQWAHDKRRAYAIADAIGLAYPRTWYPTSEADLGALDCTFPALLKPTMSITLQYALRRKALPASNPAELLDQYRRMREVVDADSIMVQEIVPGDGRTQFSVAAYCDAGTLVAGMTARRSRQYPYDYGLSSSYVEAIEVPGLLELAAGLLARLRLTGMVEVEFKRDHRDGRDKLLDINVRPWGWHGLSIACGLDFPYVQYRHVLGERPQPMRPRYGKRWRRLLTDLPAGWQEIRAGVSSPGRVLRSLKPGSVRSVFDVRDPLPLLADLAATLSRAARVPRIRARLHPTAEPVRP